jgi:hypothetical protein
MSTCIWLRLSANYLRNKRSIRNERLQWMHHYKNKLINRLPLSTLVLLQSLIPRKDIKSSSNLTLELKKIKKYSSFYFTLKGLGLSTPRHDRHHFFACQPNPITVLRWPHSFLVLFFPMLV